MFRLKDDHRKAYDKGAMHFEQAADRGFVDTSALEDANEKYKSTGARLIKLRDVGQDSAQRREYCRQLRRAFNDVAGHVDAMELDGSFRTDPVAYLELHQQLRDISDYEVPIREAAVADEKEFVRLSKFVREGGMLDDLANRGQKRVKRSENPEEVGVGLNEVLMGMNDFDAPNAPVGTGSYSMRRNDYVHYGTPAYREMNRRFGSPGFLIKKITSRRKF